MARTYAGILALVGMLFVLFRAIKDGAGFDGTMIQALAAMGLLAAVGLIVGTIAEATIDESVRQRMQAEIDAQLGAEQTSTTN
ncbi:MAG: hypothetical protein SH868_15115 [Bythopirellula sp.]|nr:hypothetical protein [Bythopirellula sp.]